MEELNSVRAKELDPKVRMHLLTKKILEHDQHSTIAKHLRDRTYLVTRFLLIIPISLILAWNIAHPHGAVLYTYTAAGEKRHFQSPFEDLTWIARWKLRTEIYLKSTQRFRLENFQKISPQEKKYKFYTWT